MDSDEEDDLDMTPDILRRRRLRARAAARAREEAFGTSTPESDVIRSSRCWRVTSDFVRNKLRARVAA
jgi:hypothetical protein